MNCVLWKNKSIWTNKIKCRVISKKRLIIVNTSNQCESKISIFLTIIILNDVENVFRGFFYRRNGVRHFNICHGFNFLAKFALKIWLTNTKKCKKLWKKKIISIFNKFYGLNSYNLYWFVMSVHLCTICIQFFFN